MSPTICICCCEPISESSRALSRNPNVCASCLSMVDGMGADNPAEVLSSAEDARKDLERYARADTAGTEDDAAPVPPVRALRNAG